MTQKCVITGCESNNGENEQTQLFKIPNNDRLDEWKTKINSVNPNIIINSQKHICIRHFEDQFICKYTQAYEKINKTKICLTKDAIPTLNLNLNVVKESEQPKVKKRGSSGLANLQKARIRKMLRKERMKNNLLKRRNSQKSRNGRSSQETSEISEYDQDHDYFLGNRKLTPAQNLIIPLRLTTLTARLHDGTKICKDTPESIKNTSTYPTFNIIQNIEGFSDLKKNPVNWTIDETFQFMKYISPIKGVAQSLRSDLIDGEAMLNLTKSDLINYFHMDPLSSSDLIRTLSQLRKEVIDRFVNI